MTSDTASLIAALEAATGPSRELDGRIYMVVLPISRHPASWEIIPRTGQIYAWSSPPPHAPGTGGVWARPPAYTASLDAALGLVPEGCLWNVKALWDGSKTAAQAFVTAYRDEPPDLKFWRWETYGLAPTPALALCIAALRAREARS